MGQDKFVERAQKLYGDQYDYSKVIYKNSVTPVTIICKDHGVYTQRPQHHLNGHRCPKCGYGTFTGDKNKKYIRISENLEELARAVHGERYNYSKFVYKGSSTKSTIICEKHGEFEQAYVHHVLQRQGCPKCNDNVSKPEQEIVDYIKTLLPKGTRVLQTDRKIIYPYELDVAIPDKRVAIEFNGTYWHSELHKDKDYHQKKVDRVERKGYRLIQIDEHMWNTQRDKFKQLIAAKLGCFSERVFARKCEVVEVSKEEADQLCEAVHVQGSCRSSVRFGLKYKGDLVGVATFGKPRFNKAYAWEILRICFAPGIQVVGGAGKLWSAFHKTHCKQGERVVSYAHRYWSDGGVYRALGFTQTDRGTPNYVWVHKTGQKPPLPRYKTQKHKLKELLGDAFDADKTERENMRAAGYLQSFDAGSLRFETTIK